MRTTGVAGVFCARHDMWHPLGLAQLTKGERYVVRFHDDAYCSADTPRRYSVMDYVVSMVHRFISVTEVVYSYDIACQWHKNLCKRAENVDGTLFQSLFAGAQALLAKIPIYVVPKFHLYAHKVYCWLRYNFLYTPGVGQTDGEGCERVWSGANPAAPSLREMGPGSMRDTLDAMCMSWNFEKVCNMGKSKDDHLVCI